MHDDADVLALHIALAVHALARGVHDRGTFEAPRRRLSVGAGRLDDEPAMRVVVVPFRDDAFDELVLRRVEHRERVMRTRSARYQQRRRGGNDRLAHLIALRRIWDSTIAPGCRGNP